MKLKKISLYQIKLPLVKPYRVSFRTYTDLEPILVEARDEDGNAGWGEAYIPAGSTSETTETGWRFCREHAERFAGKTVTEAKTALDQAVPSAPFAATAMLTAITMLERHPVLKIAEEKRIPLLVPVAATSRHEIGEEVERLLESGYRTFKVKVGWNVEQDLARVAMVQEAAAGRAMLTIDANRGYDREQGCRFAASLDPEGITLFEQPCEADAWEDNAAVARVSKVPLMLDESIRTVADIERAAALEGVGLIKLKLKRIGGIDRALTAARRAQDLGLGICLGDGVATELLCWVEACVGRDFLRRAGDMNGFLKPKTRLLKEPLAFENGSIVLKPGYWPEVDLGVIRSHQLRSEHFASMAVANA
ncbi:MAG: hypothetical protein K2Y16_02595 [Burkholderiales bacterium]|nr:hypothetical protein [Burkholderiales bacterium]